MYRPQVCMHEQSTVLLLSLSADLHAQMKRVVAFYAAVERASKDMCTALHGQATGLPFRMH